MIYYIQNQDISFATADVIVNASNGIGYMGGKTGARKKMKGVAESIQYATKGLAEKEAKKIVNFFRPSKVGTVFVTSAVGLKANYIFHAVTMRYPGGTTSYEIVKKILPQIIINCRKYSCHSIAIPLLGSGTGKLNKEEVIKLIESFFFSFDDIDVYMFVN